MLAARLLSALPHCCCCCCRCLHRQWWGHWCNLAPCCCHKCCHLGASNHCSSWHALHTKLLLLDKTFSAHYSHYMQITFEQAAAATWVMHNKPDGSMHRDHATLASGGWPECAANAAGNRSGSSMPAQPDMHYPESTTAAALHSTTAGACLSV